MQQRRVLCGRSPVLLLLLGAGLYLNCTAQDSEGPTLPLGTCSLTEPSQEAFACQLAAFGGYAPQEASSESRVVMLAPANAMACTELESGATYNDSIVIVRRGQCAFDQKLRHVEAAGAAGMILVNGIDSLIRLGSLEYGQMHSLAVSMRKSDGERLITILQQQQGKLRIRIGVAMSRQEQILHRIEYLVATNVPLVAYETYFDAIPPAMANTNMLLDAIIGDADESLTEFLDQSREDHGQWLEFFSHCSALFSITWEFTNEVTLHASAAVVVLEFTQSETAEHSELLFVAAKRFLRSGYYSHSEWCLAKLLRLNPTHEMARCLLAMVQFTRSNLVNSIPIASSCFQNHIDLNSSVPSSLSVAHENLQRLASFELSEDDFQCLNVSMQPVSRLNQTSHEAQRLACCQRRMLPDPETVADTLMGKRRRHSLMFQSSFVEELFHSLNIMGVFLDELGAFNESLLFFEHLAALCGDEPSLKLRRTLAVPIVFQSQAASGEFFSRMTMNIQALQRQQDTQELVLTSLGGTEHTESFLLRPEVASYLQYTITPPTMFIGYQGTDVLSLQQSIHALRMSLFPSLRSEYPPKPLLVEPVSRQPSGKRRIGFISTWFRNHSVGKLLLGVIKRLDRSQFHVSIYRCVHFLRHPDEMTTEFRRLADSYKELPLLHEDSMALLHQEALDIVIYPELGMDAWTVFLSHHRFAPIQCVFWGHPITTGNPAIDYFISSEKYVSEEELSVITTDAAQVQKKNVYHGSTFSEQVVLFPSLSTFFKKPTIAEKNRSITKAMLHLHESNHIYVCPQTLMKLHPHFDAVFGGILSRDPAASIVLLYSNSQVVWKELLRHRFRDSFGTNARRIVFMPTLPYKEFMALLSFADVILDPFPFGGGVTTLDALALGMYVLCKTMHVYLLPLMATFRAMPNSPVVTLPSAQTVMQLAAGFLRAMNATDGIVQSINEYVTRAIEFASDLELRERVRSLLKEQSVHLYEDAATIDDWNQFLANVKPR